MPKKKKTSRIARINATLDRFARLIEANARQLRKDKEEDKRQRAKDRAEARRQRAKDRAEDAKRRAEDQAKWERQIAEWERQRAKDKAESKAKAEAEAEAEAKAEAKRKEAEAKREEEEAKRRADSEQSLKEMKASLSNLGRHVRGIGISIGDITETIILNDKIIKQVKKVADVDINIFAGNLERTYKIDPDGELAGTNKKQFEIDGLIIGKSAVMPIEAKTKLNKGDIIDFLKGLPKFRTVFPEYAHHDVYAGVAFIRANDKTLAYAEKKGLFIIKAEPPNVMLVNSEGFKPTKFA